jgi:hypothetical protein
MATTTATTRTRLAATTAVVVLLVLPMAGLADDGRTGRRTAAAAATATTMADPVPTDSGATPAMRPSAAPAGRRRDGGRGGFDHDAHARRLLDAESRAGARLHPLQEAAPDRNLVVCDGGCSTGTVVYDAPRAVPTPPSEGDAAPTMPTCTAGCYTPTPRTAARVSQTTRAEWLQLMDELRR